MPRSNRITDIQGGLITRLKVGGFPLIIIPCCGRQSHSPVKKLTNQSTSVFRIILRCKYGLQKGKYLALKSQVEVRARNLPEGRKNGLPLSTPSGTDWSGLGRKGIRAVLIFLHPGRHTHAQVWKATRKLFKQMLHRNGCLRYAGRGTKMLKRTRKKQYS